MASRIPTEKRSCESNRCGTVDFTVQSLEMLGTHCRRNLSSSLWVLPVYTSGILGFRFDRSPKSPWRLRLRGLIELCHSGLESSDTSNDSLSCGPLLSGQGDSTLRGSGARRRRRRRHSRIWAGGRRTRRTSALAASIHDREAVHDLDDRGQGVGKRSEQRFQMTAGSCDPMWIC